MPAQREPTPKPAPSIELDAEERERQIAQNQSLIALLDSWINADEEEIQDQKETWEFLKKALDEDRPSYRKLFP